MKHANLSTQRQYARKGVLASGGEEFFEGREHFVGYVVMDARERVRNRNTSELLWGALAEAYVEGGCELHVHFRAGLVEGGVAGDWCAVFNRKRDWLDFVSSHTFGNPEGKSGKTREQGDVWQPVLVDIGKLVELPKGIIGEPMPSVVRLQPLDRCLRFWVDAPDFVAAFPRLHLPVPEDGELQEPRPVFGQGVEADVRDGEFVDEVVESGAEIMETVANDKAKFGGGWSRTSTQ